jgi:hypothetical protein
MGADRLQLRGEDEAAADPAVIHRLLAHAVPRQGQRPLPAIPQGDGEHAGRAGQRGFQAPEGDRLDQHLGVGMAAPGVVGPRFVHGRAQLAEIVDLAIHHHDEPPVGRLHGLVAGGGQIVDRQAAEAEGDGRVGRGPQAGVIGAAMHQAIAHSLNDVAAAIGPATRSRPHSHQPAHV